MGQPTGSDLHVSRPLTNISVAYIQGPENGFVADQVFPPVPSDKKYDKYYTYNKGDWFRTAAQKRAPRTESAGTGWSVGTDTFACEVEAVHTDIADEDRANSDRPVIDMDRDGTLLITRDILLRRELDWVSTFFGASKWGTTDQQGAATAGTNQFIQWDRTSSTPIEDVEDVRVNMTEATGLRPNVFVIGSRVFSTFKNHSQFIERIKYSQKGVVTLDLIAGLLDVDKVLTPMAVQNTAEEGAADAFSFIYGKHALLAYAAPSPGLLTPTAGYTFEWTGFLGAAVRGTRVKKFRMEQLEADRLEVESAYDFKMVASDLATFFKDAVQ